jgi:hypothetical protein
MLMGTSDKRMDILSVCSGARRLALSGAHPTILPLLEKMNWQYLSAKLEYLFGPARIGALHADLHIHHLATRCWIEESDSRLGSRS